MPKCLPRVDRATQPSLALQPAWARAAKARSQMRRSGQRRVRTAPAPRPPMAEIWQAAPLLQ